MGLHLLLPFSLNPACKSSQNTTPGGIPRRMQCIKDRVSTVCGVSKPTVKEHNPVYEFKIFELML